MNCVIPDLILRRRIEIRRRKAYRKSPVLTGLLVFWLEPRDGMINRLA